MKLEEKAEGLRPKFEEKAEGYLKHPLMLFFLIFSKYISHMTSNLSEHNGACDEKFYWYMMSPMSSESPVKYFLISK